MLAVGVGLSHAGTVRLVDRLAAEGLIERRGHSTDGSAISHRSFASAGLRIERPSAMTSSRDASTPSLATSAATMAAPTVQSTPNCTKEASIEKAATARNQLLDVLRCGRGHRDAG
jgi:hypothetical protein